MTPVFFILVTVGRVLVFYFLQTWLMDCSMLIHLIIFWHAVNLVMLNDSTHVVLIPNGIDDRQFDQHFSLTPWGAAPKNRPTKKEQPEFHDSIAWSEGRDMGLMGLWVGRCDFQRVSGTSKGWAVSLQNGVLGLKSHLKTSLKLDFHSD